MLQRGEAPARADVLVGRVPAVVAVVQWEGRVRMYLGFEFVVVVVPVAQMPNHSLSSCAKAYANNEGRVEDQKEGNGSIHTVLCALGRLKSFGFVYIRNYFINLKQNETRRHK